MKDKINDGISNVDVMYAKHTSSTSAPTTGWQTTAPAWENGKYVAAICAGPTVLADLGITNGKQATCYPGCEGGMGSAIVAENAATVRDGNLITGTAPGCSVKFGLALVEALKGKDAAADVEAQLVIR